MAFTVISNSFKDGDYLPNDFILSADFGFGCAGATSRRTFNGRTPQWGHEASPSPAMMPPVASRQPFEKLLASRVD